MNIRTTNHNGHLYAGPIPAEAVIIGDVQRADGQRGALIRLANGRYVQANAGTLRTLPQREVAERLGGEV